MTFDFIKENCGQVETHSYRKTGYMGNQYGTGYIDRCGFYTKRACNPRNCPLHNQIRGYESKVRDLQFKFEESE